MLGRTWGTVCSQARGTGRENRVQEGLVYLWGKACQSMLGRAGLGIQGRRRLPLLFPSQKMLGIWFGMYPAYTTWPEDQESRQVRAHQRCFRTPCVSTHLVSKALFYLKVFHVSHHLSIQEDCLDVRQGLIANSQHQ